MKKKSKEEYKKRNIEKKLMLGLQNAKEKGIILSEFEKKNHLDLESSTKLIQIWKEQGKVICIKEDKNSYMDKYALSRYFKI